MHDYLGAAKAQGECLIDFLRGNESGPKNGLQSILRPVLFSEGDSFSGGSGATAFGFRWILRFTVEAVFAILLLFLLAAFLAFFALFASVTHGISGCASIIQHMQPG
jgi:hypothetical protein